LSRVLINKRITHTEKYDFNYIGLVILIIGALFLAMSITKPDNFFVYKMLKSISALCWGQDNAPKVMAYSLMMMIFGLLLMLRVFGNRKLIRRIRYSDGLH